MADSNSNDNLVNIDSSMGGDVEGVGSKKEEDDDDDKGKLIDESTSSGKKRKINDEDVEVETEVAAEVEPVVAMEDTNENSSGAKTEEPSSSTTDAPTMTIVASTSTAAAPTTTTTTSTTGNISIASVASAAQLSSAMGWNGLGSILSLSLLTSTTVNTSSSSSEKRISSSEFPASQRSGGGNSNSVTMPVKDQVLQAATKAVNESPPFVHFSRADSAPQIKITNSEYATSTSTTTTTTTTSSSSSSNTANDIEAQITVNDHLVCKQQEGEMRGYRMARASHGVNSSAGSYYYEVIIQKPPTAKELVNSLPSNVRLGPKLQREMQEALEAEEERESKVRKENESKTMKDDDQNMPPVNNADEVGKVTGFGSHVRLGWSMRTGDLQAPVGYDKWSYGVRSIGGSKIHCSRREDHWGGEPFESGDVVGCAISMVSDGSEKGDEREGTDIGTTGGRGQQPRGNENHIRFFKNGLPMGEFVISKGKREGGAAFIVPNGVYYPAISLYMGATVKVNFGPNFIYPPRKLPTGLKFRPMSNLCQPPLSIEESSVKVAKERTFRKADTQQKFLELVQTETRVLADAYQNHRKKHVIDVWKERTKRNLKIEDLENDEFFPTDRDILTRMV
ncbi:MAG: Set1/Ash2 histone methyltransferase complex subunit ASH2 [Bacillariaceae sp.]|jgi:Set1/Ash2 histone methyltransferase complex subunit ASH2